MRGYDHSEEMAALEGVFRDESMELLERLEGCLLDLEHDAANLGLVEESFRHLHTLKGIAAMYGFNRLSALAHGLESDFDAARRTGEKVPGDVIAIALRSLDCMRALASGSGGDEASEARHEADQLLASLSRAVDSAGPVALQAPGEQAWQSASGYRLVLRPGSDAFFRGLRPQAILNELRSLGECVIEADTSAVPRLEDLDHERLYLSWHVELHTEAPPERVREALMFLLEDEYEMNTIGDEGESGSGPAEERRGGEERRSGSCRASDFAADETVRVSTNRLDQLVDMVGELVTAHGALAAIAGESNDARLAGTAEDIGNLVGGLRESVLEIRMVPFGTLFGRFRRHVRDLGAELGKDVEILADGAETEMDKGVLDRIAEPILHILRNCVDHGIEIPDDRAAASKPSRGTIRLSASQAGGLVCIEITDDGRGLDLCKIRERALSSGIMTADADVADEDLVHLLFDSGFSTSDAVTRVSGRGVGLDVVKRTLDDLNGSIAISSSMGDGTCIRLSVPLTLAIIDGLLAKVGEERYVIPLAAVESCEEARQPDVWREHGRELLDVHGTLVPLVRLRSFFDVPGDAVDGEIAVIAMLDGKRCGIVVDSIQDSIQAVIKPFGRFVRSVHGLSGTTVLGDGMAVPVLDPGDLLRVAESHQGLA